MLRASLVVIARGPSIAIQHGKFILLTPLAIFPMLLGEIHSSPSGKFPYTY